MKATKVSAKIKIAFLSVLMVTTAGCGKQNVTEESTEKTKMESQETFERKAEVDEQENNVKERIDKEQEPSSQKEFEEESRETEENTIDCEDEPSLLQCFIQLEEQDRQYLETMNSTTDSSELKKVAELRYTLWDEELNALWSSLKNIMTDDEMQELLLIQREWISDKEAALGQETEAYSKEQKGAELTRRRSYELASIVSEKTGDSFVAPLLEESLFQGTIMDDFLSMKTNVIMDHLTVREDDGTWVNMDGEEFNLLELANRQWGDEWCLDSHSIEVSFYERYGARFWLIKFWGMYPDDPSSFSLYVLMEKTNGLHCVYSEDGWCRSSLVITRAGLIYSDGSSGAGLHGYGAEYLDQDGNRQKIFSYGEGYPWWVRDVISSDEDFAYSEESIRLAEEIDYSLENDSYFSVAAGSILGKEYCSVFWDDDTEKDTPELLNKLIESTTKDGATWLSEQEFATCLKQAVMSCGFTEAEVGCDESRFYTDNMECLEPEWVVFRE